MKRFLSLLALLVCLSLLAGKTSAQQLAVDLDTSFSTLVPEADDPTLFRLHGNNPTPEGVYILCAYLVAADGTRIDVTQLCQWEINAGSWQAPGVVQVTGHGTNRVEAVFMGWSGKFSFTDDRNAHDGTGARAGDPLPPPPTGTRSDALIRQAILDGFNRMRQRGFPVDAFQRALGRIALLFEEKQPGQALGLSHGSSDDRTCKEARAAVKLVSNDPHTRAICIFPNCFCLGLLP